MWVENDSGLWIKKQKLYNSKNHNRRKTQIRLKDDSKVTPRWLQGDSKVTFEKWPRDDIAKTLLSERFL